MKKTLIIIGVVGCIYCKCYAQAVSVTIQDSTEKRSADFVDEIGAFLKHDDLGLEGKIKIVPAYDWEGYKSDSRSRDNHYRSFGKYFCVFKIKRGPNGTKNLSAKMIDLTSDDEHIIFDKNILKTDLDNAINIILHYHIQTLLKNSGWKQSLYIFDNQKERICNNYVSCFDTLYYNPQIYKRYYVQRYEKIWPDEIRCTNDDTTKGPIQFIYLKNNIKVGSPLSFYCDCKNDAELASFRRALENFFKIITK